MKYPYLKDTTFLQEFYSQRIKEQTMKIIALDWKENPLQEITGKVTSGSITINGSSSMRRTCNLSLLADEESIDIKSVNNLLSINKKVSLEIGFTNFTNKYLDYPILWFPLGVYVIIQPSISNTLSGISISLQLKDKMCLLNGECGGTFPGSVTFHEQSYIDEDGNEIIERPLVYTIIQELVNHFGGEQLGKIIISDIDSRVKKVMKWTGSAPLYIMSNTTEDGTQYEATLTKPAANYKAYGSEADVGYIYTDFVYLEDLISNAGDNVCTILDKIKSYLGNYEYYYDLEGNFIFQEVKNYLNTSYVTGEIDKLTNSDYLADFSKGKAVWVFDNSDLITSYSATPQYNMIKNDFIVWGIRNTAEGESLPIRYHLAIDTKPNIGNTYEVYLCEDQDTGNVKAHKTVSFNQKSDFPKTGTAELYYQDKSTNQIYIWNGATKEYVVQTNGYIKTITTTDWRTELYLAGIEGENLGLDTNYYYTELKNEWPKLYDLENQCFKESVLANPTSIDYYLDFIDSSAAVGELAIQNIGRRSRTESNNNVNCVFAAEIPNLVLIEAGQSDTSEKRAECEAAGQDYIQVESSIFSQLSGGGSSNSAYSAVREMLYQYTNYNESISISALPHYHLEPNTRITVRDNQSKIYGDYIISQISLPLDISSTMTISATKALERI